MEKTEGMREGPREGEDASPERTSRPSANVPSSLRSPVFYWILRRNIIVVVVAIVIGSTVVTSPLLATVLDTLSPSTRRSGDKFPQRVVFCDAQGGENLASFSRGSTSDGRG